MPKKVLVAFPPAMLEQMDFIAQAEHRTRSDLVREALRQYMDSYKRRNQAAFTVSTIAQPTPTPVEIADEYRAARISSHGISKSGVTNESGYVHSAETDDIYAAAQDARYSY